MKDINYYRVAGYCFWGALGFLLFGILTEIRTLMAVAELGAILATLILISTMIYDFVHGHMSPPPTLRTIPVELRASKKSVILRVKKNTKK
jgi:hypothetical protein